MGSVTAAKMFRPNVGYYVYTWPSQDRCEPYWAWLLLFIASFSAILCSQAESLHGIMKAVGDGCMVGAKWNCCHLDANSVYILPPCTSFQCHFINTVYGVGLSTARILLLITLSGQRAGAWKYSRQQMPNLWFTSCPDLRCNCSSLSQAQAVCRTGPRPGSKVHGLGQKAQLSISVPALFLGNVLKQKLWKLGGSEGNDPWKSPTSQNWCKWRLCWGHF